MESESTELTLSSKSAWRCYIENSEIIVSTMGNSILKSYVTYTSHYCDIFVYTMSIASLKYFTHCLGVHYPRKKVRMTVKPINAFEVSKSPVLYTTISARKSQILS